MIVDLYQQGRHKDMANRHTHGIAGSTRTPAVQNNQQTTEDTPDANVQVYTPFQ